MLLTLHDQLNFNSHPSWNVHEMKHLLLASGGTGSRQIAILTKIAKAL
jgi:hypothetical protein